MSAQRQQPTAGISLNVHLAVPSGAAVGTDNGSHTPNTPEILNSIVNMQCGPFSEQLQAAQSQAAQADSACKEALCDSSNGAEVGPIGSVQHYRSQFIKEGLKMKVQQKLESTGKPMPPMPALPPLPDYSSPSPRHKHASESASSDTMPFSPASIKREELTEEDEMRRQRRRERNKIAATKCRNKKKARTQTLLKESDVLESHNNHLKVEIGRLEAEKQRLTDMLSGHQPSCAKRPRQHAASASRPSYTAQRPQYSSGGVPTIYVEDLAGQYDACSASAASSSSSSSFLAKRSLGHTYLDLDSRCIAL